MKKFIKGITVVNKIGNPEDYVNIPIVENNKAIGVITNATELEDGYELETLLFKVSVELTNDTPIAIIIG